MRKFMTVAFVALVILTGSIQLRTPAAKPGGGGGCGCSGTTPVCCKNCNGTFAYCARSYAFCPECPAP
jgi:hypothetical protein